MTGPVVSGTNLLALPYYWRAPENAEHNVRLLDEMVAHPNFYRQKAPDEATRRLIAAAMLTAPDTAIWGVWQEGEFCGVIHLSKIAQDTDGAKTLGYLDCTFHVLFLDHNLIGKQRLLERFLAYCLVRVGFQRISAEVPEDAEKLLRFYRALGFRYEGEGRASALLPVASAAPAGRATTPTATTIAKYGSRVEGVFWRTDRWIDVLRLRILRDERSPEPHAHSRNSRSRPNRGGLDREGHRPQSGDDHRPASEGSPAKP